MQDNALKKIILDWSILFMRLSMHDFNHYTRTTGQSLSQMNVLIHLYYKGPSEVMNLTELMMVSPAGASQMVERMVQQGFVQRLESPTDRRVRLVHITTEGKKCVEESIAARQAWMEKMIASLSEEEKEQIAETLTLLTEKSVQFESQNLVNK